MSDLIHPNTHPTQVFYLIHEAENRPISAQRMTGQKASALNILLTRSRQHYRWMTKGEAEGLNHYVDPTTFNAS